MTPEEKEKRLEIRRQLARIARTQDAFWNTLRDFECLTGASIPDSTPDFTGFRATQADVDSFIETYTEEDDDTTEGGQSV